MIACVVTVRTGCSRWGITKQSLPQDEAEPISNDTVSEKGDRFGFPNLEPFSHSVMRDLAVERSPNM